MKRGFFITFEGGEGSGKSTQLSRLAAKLEAAGIDLLVTREPGGSPAAEDLRDLLVTGDGGRWLPFGETLLHFAARQDHVARVIRPALEEECAVLCDRYFDSTMAYQGYGQGVPRDRIRTLSEWVCGDCRPDLTLILDLPVEIGLKRAAARKDSETRYEEMEKAFHERLRQGFLDIARQEPKRCRIIDAASSPDGVEAAIWDAVVARFPDVAK
jgi:dTMP kinase